MKDKKVQILQAAIRLLADHGIGVSTANIAREAKVCNGTLFNYFATKKMLIDAVYLSIHEYMIEDILHKVDFTDSPKNIFLQVWKLYISWRINHSREDRVLNLLQSSRLLDDDIIMAGHMFWQPVHEILERAIREKIVIDAPVLFLIELIMGQLRATIAYAQSNKKPLSKKALDGLIELSFTVHWNGIKRT